jgi:hypothetical protein
MRERNLIVKIRRKNPYKMIMKKTQEHRVSRNVLNRNFQQNIPGQVLCTDITYLYYGLGRKAYLSAIKDIASKEIVSWQMSNNLTMKFVLDSVDSLKNIGTIKKNPENPAQFGLSSPATILNIFLEDEKKPIVFLLGAKTPTTISMYAMLKHNNTVIEIGTFLNSSISSFMVNF